MEVNEKGVRKGAWTKEEDILLKNCIEKYGEGKWHQVPIRAGLNRCRKSCRLRWLNYLRPDIKRDYFTKDEVDLILRLHKLLGNRWSLIAGRLPGRTANHVKNFWNTHIINKSAAAKEGRCRPPETPANKGITNSSNVIRPRPRTLKIARAQVPAERTSEASNSSKQPSSPNDWNTENPENNQHPSPLFSREEVEECNLWWSTLLDIAENGDGTKLFSFSDFDSLLGLESSPVGLDG